MNNKEIEQIIKKNNKIEQSMINKENNNSEPNIIIQSKKISPFIEIIDSSRLDDNIVEMNKRNSQNNSLEEKKDNYELSCEKENRKNNKESLNFDRINEEPMSFKPKKKNNYLNNNLNTNSNTSSNKNFVTFKTDDCEEINNQNNNTNINKNNVNLKNNSFNNEEKEVISKSSFYKIGNTANYDADYINDINKIIDILKISIEKIKSYINKNNETVSNNCHELLDDKILINNIMNIKNNIIKVFDKIIINKTKNNFLSQKFDDYIDNSIFCYKNSNFKSSNYQSPFKVAEKPIFKIPNEDINNNLYETNENFFSSFLNIKDLNNSFNNFNFKNNSNDNLMKKINDIEEIDNIFRNQIINLKGEIFIIKQENNNLKQIIDNLKQLMEELTNQNKLLSSKLIKYKKLYEEKNK